jgi:DNA repair protein RecO (recombination protein O)
VPARAEHDDALVLRSVDYGEADRIVTLLTRRHGKLSALARSARKSRRRFAGALEGFAVVDAELAIGSGDLARLQSARVMRIFPGVLCDLERMSVAGALLRLGRDLVAERVADEALFEEFVGMLELLERADVIPAALHLAFEIRLLAITGFAPLLSACGVCGKVPTAGRAAEFDPARGCLVCQACGGAPLPLRGAVRARLVEAMQGSVLSVAQLAWQPTEREEAERLLENFVAHRLQRAPAAHPTRR